MNPQDPYQASTPPVNPEPPVNQLPSTQPPSGPPDPRQPVYTEHQERVGNELMVMQPGEQVICVIKRHPIGLIANYIVTGFILIVIAVMAFIVAPQVIPPENGAPVTQVGAVIFLVAAVLCLGFNLIATKIYWGNSWVVTSDSVTQIEQTGLFTRHSSQLSMANIEDVTAEQNGLLTQLFKFGVLKAETAGHRSKFVFPYAPNPNFYAQKILATREAFERGMHGLHANYPVANNQDPLPAKERGWHNPADQNQA